MCLQIEFNAHNECVYSIDLIALPIPFPSISYEMRIAIAFSIRFIYYSRKFEIQIHLKFGTPELTMCFVRDYRLRVHTIS